MWTGRNILSSAWRKCEEPLPESPKGAKAGLHGGVSITPPCTNALNSLIYKGFKNVHKNAQNEQEVKIGYTIKYVSINHKCAKGKRI